MSDTERQKPIIAEPKNDVAVIHGDPTPGLDLRQEAINASIAKMQAEIDLNERDTLFLSAYLNRENPVTYLNATKSYLFVHPETSPDVARAISYQTMARIRRTGAIQYVCELLGVGSEVRIYKLAQIALGSATRVVKTISGDKVTITEAGPTFQQQLQAIKELSILDGTRARLSLVKDVAKSKYRDIVKSAKRALDDKGDITVQVDDDAQQST